jgi:hypothetical protein
MRIASTEHVRCCVEQWLDVVGPQTGSTALVLGAVLVLHSADLKIWVHKGSNVAVALECRRGTCTNSHRWWHTLVSNVARVSISKATRGWTCTHQTCGLQSYKGLAGVARYTTHELIRTRQNLLRQQLKPYFEERWKLLKPHVMTSKSGNLHACVDCSTLPIALFPVRPETLKVRP